MKAAPPAVERRLSGREATPGIQSTQQTLTAAAPLRQDLQM